MEVRLKMAKLTVPESCKKEVPVEQIAKVQEMVEYTLKDNETKRETTRYRVNVSDDGKTATLTDTQHPDYVKYQEERAKLPAKIKLETSVYKQRLKKQRDIGAKIGAVNALREYKKSEKYQKTIAAAEKRGAREAKPKANAAEQLAKAKARKAKEEAKIAKLEAKTKE